MNFAFCIVNFSYNSNSDFALWTHLEPFGVGLFDDLTQFVFVQFAYHGVIPNIITDYTIDI